VGSVIARSGENWRVDIGGAHMATLDGLAFEGATKRNRPNLKVTLHFSSAIIGS
jgi:exosome complex component RRP40